MIISYGIDIMQPSRIQAAICAHGEGFLSRIYTTMEVESARRKRYQSGVMEVLTAYWSVKEATMKALGTGNRQGVKFKDIEVCHENSGRPYIELYGIAKEIADKLGVKNIFVSMSHLDDMVVAGVIFEG
ncbi:holo-ACP synthase [Candidatus Woesearchaeota archaeon]|nr:holo-ACP synthase [Candidatus Woesearchaeota archaeon]